MKNSNRYEALDGIKALACLGIVSMHVLTNAKYNVNGFLFKDFIPSLTNLVFLFMTISGFGMCCGYYERFINKQIDIADFYKKRYKKILPFFALLCALDFGMSPSLTSLYEVFANLTLCFGLIPNANITVIGVGWFLGTVFAFYLLFPFFCFLISDKKRAWIGFVASIIMNYLCANHFDANRTAIVYSFVYFMAGGMVCIYRDKIQEIKNKQPILLLMIAILAVCYYMTDVKTIIMIAFNMVVLIYAMGASAKNILNAKPFKFLGTISFEVYLCHMLVYRVYEKMYLLKLFTNDYVNYLIVYVAVVAGAMAFAYVGKNIVGRIMGFWEAKFGVSHI